MAICFCGRIKQRCMNEELFESFLTDYYFWENNIIRESNENCVTYQFMNSEEDVIISFMNEKKAPYNVYDSGILGEEFEYAQLILFDIKKENASVDKYKEIIRFFLCLKEKINSDILVTSDVHNDICLLQDEVIIWSQELPFDYR